VKELSNNAGFNIINGRKGYEDFTIKADDRFTLKESILIEIKFSKSPGSKLDYLRQFDDCGTSLSGEDEFRKRAV